MIPSPAGSSRPETRRLVGPGAAGCGIHLGFFPAYRAGCRAQSHRLRDRKARSHSDGRATHVAAEAEARPAPPAATRPEAARRARSACCTSCTATASARRSACRRSACSRHRRAAGARAAAAATSVRFAQCGHGTRTRRRRESGPANRRPAATAVEIIVQSPCANRDRRDRAHPVGELAPIDRHARTTGRCKTRAHCHSRNWLCASHAERSRAPPARRTESRSHLCLRDDQKGRARRTESGTSLRSASATRRSTRRRPPERPQIDCESRNHSVAHSSAASAAANSGSVMGVDCRYSMFGIQREQQRHGEAAAADRV